MNRYFIDNKQIDCFAAGLFTCYDLLRPDVVMELAWRNGLTDFAMPFMIQTMRDLTLKVSVLESANLVRSDKEVEKEKLGNSIIQLYSFI